MRRFIFTVLSIAALAMPATAATDVKTPAPERLKVAQAQAMAVALRNLDGHMVVIKQGGADATVMVPWDFGSGSLRLRIANNITILDAVAKAVEESRLAIIREITKKAGITEIKPGTPEFDDFQKQYGQLMDSPAVGTENLARIKASELKMDKNELPVTVLSVLGPILDDDTGGK